MVGLSVAVQSIIEKVNCLGNVNLLKVRGGQPIFYTCDGRLMRLAQKIVKATGFVPQDEAWRGPVERRGTKLINGEKVSCHDK